MCRCSSYRRQARKLQEEADYHQLGNAIAIIACEKEAYCRMQSKWNITTPAKHYVPRAYPLQRYIAFIRPSPPLANDAVTVLLVQFHVLTYCTSTGILGRGL